MAPNIANIPPNAVEMLFVEDLVQWLLRRQARVKYEFKIAGPYRDIILNVFNEDVRNAVNFIDMSLESEIDEQFADLEELNEKSFLQYAIQYEKMHFRNGFQADCFLEYCVRLVSMAILFARRNVPEAINISIYIMLKLLENRDMFTGGWDSVFEVSSKYAKIYEDLYNVLTPESSDDEHLMQNMERELPEQNSENESLVDSSENESLADSLENERENSSENELRENSSADCLHVNEENPVCNFIPNRFRSKLQKPKAKKVIKPKRSPI